MLALVGAVGEMIEKMVREHLRLLGESRSIQILSLIRF